MTSTVIAAVFRRKERRSVAPGLQTKCGRSLPTVRSSRRGVASQTRLPARSYSLAPEPVGNTGATRSPVISSTQLTRNVSPVLWSTANRHHSPSLPAGTISRIRCGRFQTENTPLRLILSLDGFLRGCPRHLLHPQVRTVQRIYSEVACNENLRFLRRLAAASKRREQFECVVAKVSRSWASRKASVPPGRSVERAPVMLPMVAASGGSFLRR